ncbi:HAD family hydrolase [Micromonospora sp. NPDC050980]|uniref:HAD family hydrolase n=1 Tax=Micromonospora sp. NPDC050980 TaxID=3155161 RepID=UPI003407A7FA
MKSVQLIALDVGGVIYFDEPFELAWIHQVFARARTADPSFTASSLIRDMKVFYAAPASHHRAGTVFSRPLARQSWLETRALWSELVQPIPGAVDAVRQLAGRYDLCVVANQPPECAAALGQIHLGDAFKLVALDSTVGYAKPDPRLLGWALDKLRASPAQTLVVGNRWDHDIEPAGALGCLTTLIRPSHGWDAPSGCDQKIVEAYRELRSQVISRNVNGNAAPVAAGLGEVATTLSQVLDRRT